MTGLGVERLGLKGRSDLMARSEQETEPPPPPPEPVVPLLPNGSRVLVALADGLMHSALIRQAMQGYYELEIEASGDTVWVPVNMVSPQH